MESWQQIIELFGQAGLLILAVVFLAKQLKEQLTARIESVEKRADLCEKDRGEMRDRYERELTDLRDKYEKLLSEIRDD